MSVPRIRKVVASEDGPRARHPVVAKSSPDSIACNVRTNPQPLRSRSKNKIPKSVRYDLENALVSLCDVWFEEIKPHLVRNNIKLHVHGSNAGGDHQRVPEPAPTGPEAPASPGCSHLDPGAASDHRPRRSASSVGCCSTLPTASRARCARLPTPSRRPLSPLLSVPQTPHECEQNQSHNCEEKKLERPRRRRRHRRSQPKPSRRVRRLCHTYIAQGADAGRSASHAPTSQPSAPTSSHDHYLKFVVPRHGMKNKNTQTKSVLPSMSRGSQYKPPKTHWIPVPRDVSPRSQGTKICSPRSLNVRKTAVPNCEISSRSNPRNLSSQNPDSNPGTCKQSSISPSKRNLAPANLERALAEPSPPRLNCRLKRPKRTAAVDLPLFQDDLIDIIGESNDMRLRLMRSSTSSSPQKEDHPSCMNLFRIDRHAKPGGLNKIPPWK